MGKCSFFVTNRHTLHHNIYIIIIIIVMVIVVAHHAPVIDLGSRLARVSSHRDSSDEEPSWNA